MNGWLVAEMDILCLLICLFVFIKEWIASNKAIWENRHERLMMASMLFIVSDLLYRLLEYNCLPPNEALAYLFNGVYYLLLVMICVMWYIIVEEFVGITYRPNTFRYYRRMLPAAAFTVLLALTPVNGWIFTININCEFERGPFNFLLFALCYGYFAASTLHLCLSGTSNKTLSYRHRRNSILVFPLPLFVSSIVQVFFPQLSITPIGCTFSLLLNYELYRMTIASVDSLTTIRNRTSMIYFMEDLWQKDPGFCCMMIDIDGFKGVNDTYGHVTGDILLRQFGSTLGKVAEQFGMTAARYAGDEFLVVCREKEAEKVPLFWEAFEEAMSHIKIPGTEKTVGASMGYALMKPEYSSLRELISRCDSEMYLNKSNRKKQRV